ncbi:MAG: HDOD domain-containing protein [Myxococcota bacterium]
MAHERIRGPLQDADALPTWLSAARRARQPRSRTPTLPPVQAQAELECAEDGSLQSLEGLERRPPVVSSLCLAAGGARPTARDVTALTRLDRGAAERVLAVVRSGLFGPSADLLDLRSVISSLGIPEVARLALGVTVVNAMRVRDRERLRAHWMEAFLSASLAKHVIVGRSPRRAPPEREPTVGELWSGAALQDVGRLVLEDLHPDYADAVWQRLEITRATLADVEASLGPVRHAAVGHRFAEDWELPESIAALCRDHEHRARTEPELLREESPLTALLAGTSRLAALARGRLSARAGERVRTEACALLALEMPDALALMHHVVALRDAAQRLAIALAPVGS